MEILEVKIPDFRISTTNSIFSGVRDVCEELISNKNVQIISNLEDGQNFLKSMDTNLRPKVIIFSDKTTPTNSFKMLSSQFRGEIDFAFAYHHDHDIRLEPKALVQSHACQCYSIL